MPALKITETIEANKNKTWSDVVIKRDGIVSLVYMYLSRIVRKPDVSLCENKGTDQLRSNCEADQCLFFATHIVQFLFFNPKFQASVIVQVGLCQTWSEPRRPVLHRVADHLQFDPYLS